MDRDDAREERIEMEIVVDAYDPAERAMGWHAYVDGRLAFPFASRVVAERAVSPLRVGDAVTVTGMGPGEDCESDLFVWTAWAGRRFAAPLSQLAPENTDEQTEEAVADWHYWVARGYRFG